MPVKDAGPYLDAAIQSVLDQSLGDFEFIIRDDGSTDGSTDRLRDWAARDSRIKLFLGGESLGPAASSNWVVAQAAGEFVARMDADDICRSDRLSRQVEVLRERPDACLVGTLWEGIDEGGRLVRPRDRWRLSRPSAFSPFPHGSIMFRRSAFDQVGGYRVDANYWEDADLYLRLAEVGRLLVLPEPLYLHRASTLSTRLTSDRDIVETSVDRMYRRLSGLPPACGEKLLPRVFVSIGSTRLWAGRSPAVLRRLIGRARLGFNGESAAVLAWALWGSLSPASLRFVLRGVVKIRDRAVRGHFRDGQPQEWRIPGLSQSSVRCESAQPPRLAVIPDLAA
jgi:glycosyltransferase involved in cell wall biosynthesis